MITLFALNSKLQKMTRNPTKAIPGIPPYLPYFLTSTPCGSPGSSCFRRPKTCHKRLQQWYQELGWPREGRTSWRFDPTMHKNPRRLEQLDLRYKGRQVGPLFCKKTIENQKFLARVDALRIKVSVSQKKHMRLEKILESWCKQESGIEERKKPEVEENRLYQAGVCLTFLDQQWLSCCALVKNDETKSDQENHPYSRMHWHNSVRKLGRWERFS